MNRNLKLGLHAKLLSRANRSIIRNFTHLSPIATLRPWLSLPLYKYQGKSTNYIKTAQFQLNLQKQQKMNLLTISQSLDESYSKHKIIPDVIDKFTTQGLLTIDYGNDNLVTLGNRLKVSDTQEKPKIQFTLNSPGEKELSILSEDKFALVLTDPDAPLNSDTKWSQYAHWIITDLKLNSKSDDVQLLSTVLDYSTGNEILPYEGPEPPEGSGPHRYVFLLFKQDPNVKYEAPPDRPTWGTDVPRSGYKEWIKKHGGKLQLLSVNFFYAEEPGK